MACLRIPAQKGRREGRGLACISAGLYHPLAAESKPGEVWAGRVGSSLTWNHICQVETTGVLFYAWNQILSLLSGVGSIEEEDWGALCRALSQKGGEKVYTQRKTTHCGRVCSHTDVLWAVSSYPPSQLCPGPPAAVWLRDRSASTRWAPQGS